MDGSPDPLVRHRRGLIHEAALIAGAEAEADACLLGSTGHWNERNRRLRTNHDGTTALPSHTVPRQRPQARLHILPGRIHHQVGPSV
jgi:hypothetical protein